MTMRTILIVSLLIAAVFALDQAAASSDLSSANPGYKALAIRPGAGSSSRRLFQSGSECGTDLASPVWAPGGRQLGYECVENANGS
jgi:hypothetical protein